MKLKIDTLNIESEDRTPTDLSRLHTCIARSLSTCESPWRRLRIHIFHPVRKNGWNIHPIKVVSDRVRNASPEWACTGSFVYETFRARKLKPPVTQALVSIWMHLRTALGD